jgi:hypothetical protein
MLCAAIGTSHWIDGRSYRPGPSKQQLCSARAIQHFLLRSWHQVGPQTRENGSTLRSKPRCAPGFWPMSLWRVCHTQLLERVSAPYVQCVLNPFDLLFGEIYPPTTVRTSTERRKVRLHAWIRAPGAFSENFHLRRLIQLPLKLVATFLVRPMQARVRVIKRGFQRVVVNRRPLLAVQTRVPPEDFVVSNSNQVFAVLRVTDAVQAHVRNLLRLFLAMSKGECIDASRVAWCCKAN